MSQPTIFTVYIKPNEELECHESRITRVLAGNNDVRCTEVSMDFSASGVDTLVLRIPMHYVQIRLIEKENEDATETDRTDL